MRLVPGGPADPFELHSRAAPASHHPDVGAQPALDQELCHARDRLQHFRLERLGLGHVDDEVERRPQFGKKLTVISWDKDFLPSSTKKRPE